MQALIFTIATTIVFAVTCMKIFPILAEVEPTPQVKLAGGLAGAGAGFVSGAVLGRMQLGLDLLPSLLLPVVLIGILVLLVSNGKGKP
ncbi:MAG: hypothetical protein DDT32_01967 [Syntrophomonadaceae bacterium]|nr:hypothetical protein [Bacillota bacterium]